jgi:hypothetical protein
MSRQLYVNWLFLSGIVLLMACQASDQDTPTLASEVDVVAEVVESNPLQELMEAHGGLEKWKSLTTMSVDRLHRPTYLNVGELQFTIHAEYGLNRIYQVWSNPPGEVFWDGERAWSVGWPLAGRFSERFLMSSGFFIANFPWLAYVADAKIEEINDPVPLIDGSTAPDGKVFRVFYEPDVVRKPPAYRGKRDSFDVYINAKTGRLLGIRMHRTYAGQIDTVSSPESDEIFESYVVYSETNIDGLVFPSDFSLYVADGKKVADGEFKNYRLNAQNFDDKFPAALAEGAHLDATSSYIRATAKQE